MAAAGGCQVGAGEAPRGSGRCGPGFWVFFAPGEKALPCVASMSDNFWDACRLPSSDRCNTMSSISPSRICPRLVTLLGLPVAFLLLSACASARATPGSPRAEEPKRGHRSGGFFHVTATGETMRDATRNARRLIVEDGLGAYIESNSVSVDAQLRESIVKASSSGFVYDFSITKVVSKTPVVKIEAKGKVSEKAVAQAIKYRYAEIGKPRLLILFEEEIGGQAVAAGRSLTGAKLVSRFADFQFVDPGVVRKIEASAAKPYEDRESFNRVLDAARAADADFVIVGNTDVQQGPSVEGTAMFMIKAHVRLRMVSTATGTILAEAAETHTVPFINVRQGAVPAVERAVEAVYPAILEQIGSKWEPGQTIRIVFENIEYDAFTDAGVVERMRKWERIGSVQDRGKDEAGGVVIEVEALMSGSDLYRLMRTKKGELGIDFSSLDVKSNRLRLRVSASKKGQ